MFGSAPDVYSNRFLLSTFLFQLLFFAHPLEGKRALVPITSKLQVKLYAEDPVFIFDKEDERNRPDPLVNRITIQCWEAMPEYVREIFWKAFSKEALANPMLRPSEDEQLVVMQKLYKELINQRGVYTMPKYLKTESREIKTNSEPIIIQRCEIEACLPNSAYEKCFSLNKRYPEANDLDSEAHELIVENTGYGAVSVGYYTDGQRYFDMPKEPQIGVNGCLELSIVEGKISVKAIASSKVTLHYTVGDSFIIRPGDKIYSGSKLLIEYVDDGWDDDWF